MLTHLKTIPNQLTAVRFALIPLLWVAALLRQPFVLGLGLFIALLTDALDGPLARRLKQVSEFGSKFDSLADNLLTPSAVVWLLILRPQVFSDHRTLSLAAIALYLLSLSAGWIRFRRFANLHLFSSKVGGLLEYVFLIHAFVSGVYSETLFYVAIGAFTVSSSETLLLQLTQSRVNEHMGSLLLILFRPARHRSAPKFSNGGER